MCLLVAAPSNKLDLSFVNRASIAELQNKLSKFYIQRYPLNWFKQDFKKMVNEWGKLLMRDLFIVNLRKVFDQMRRDFVKQKTIVDPKS